jgi:serine/threonine protein kinase
MLNEYRIVEVLGVGGFGITYLARDTLLEKDVAIKEYFPSGVVSRGRRARHHDGPARRGEYRGASTLPQGSAHPRHVQPSAHRARAALLPGERDRLHGDGLRARRVAAHVAAGSIRSPTRRTLLALLAPLLDGIEKVHATGFLHRDIKPDNIFIRERARRCSSTSARARQALRAPRTALTAMVTPGYAPFEQYGAGAEQGPWTDIYALGGVLVFAMTGRNPPDAIARMKVDRLGDELACRGLRYSPRVIEAVRHGMAIDEKQRPQTWPTGAALLGAMPVAHRARHRPAR